MAQTPPFLQNNPASSASSGGAHPPYESPAQKQGTSNTPDGGSPQRGPDRPQPMGAPKANPESGVSGGKLPYKGPSVPTQKPFKLGS